MTVDLSKAHVGQRYVARDGEVWTFVETKGRKHYLSEPSRLNCWFFHDGKFGGVPNPSMYDLVHALPEPAPAPSEAEDVGNAKLLEEAAAVTEWLRSMNNHNGRQVAKLIDALLAEDDVLRKKRHDDLKWKDICRSVGVCMSCAISVPDTFGCTDCLNTGWDGGSPAGFVPDKIHADTATRLEALSADNEALRRGAEGVKVPEGWQLVPKEPMPEMYGAGGVQMFKNDLAQTPVREAVGLIYTAMLAKAPTPAARDWHSKHDGGK